MSVVAPSGSFGKRSGQRRVEYRTDCLLRSAGIPIEVLHALRMTDFPEQEPGASAKEPSEKEFEVAERRYIERLARVARETAVGEAIAWQNVAMYQSNLVALDATANRKNRRRADKVFSYVSRYTAKNDTIGFYGPLSWGTVGQAPKSFFRAQQPLLDNRRLYFESWAVDEIARALARLPGVFPYLPIIIHGTLQQPTGQDQIGGADTINERITTGVRRNDTIGSLAARMASSHGDSFEDVAVGIGELVSSGRLTCVPLADVADDGLDYLQRWVAEVPDPVVRARVESALKPFGDLREELVQARGDANAVADAQSRLSQEFSRVTGADPTRRPGEQYAGRSLVYEDSTRHVEFSIGDDYLDAWDGPLSILLQAADWYVGLAGNKFEELVADTFAAASRERKSDEVLLERVFFMISERLAHGVREVSEFVSSCQAELQRRWQMFSEAAWSSHDRGRLDDLLTLAEQLFPTSDEPWPGAHVHSPDIQLLGGEPNPSGVQAVLGELHVATNSLEQPAFLRFAPRLDRVREEELKAFPNGRVRMIPPRSSRFVSSRLSPPGPITEDKWAYWTWGRSCPAVNARRVDASDLSVCLQRESNRLWVSGSDLSAPLMSVFGDLLSMTLAGTFSLCHPESSMRRVEVNGLVLSRGQWNIPLVSCDWAKGRSRARRYAAFLEWCRGASLPRQFYWRVRDSEKPQLVDQAIPASAERLATRLHGTDIDYLRVAEALPSTEEAWLRDADGHHYSSEVRLVARLSPSSTGLPASA